MKIKAIVTGVTGMVGEGVLLECLGNPNVEQVLVLGRKSCGITHPKLKEVLHPNFQDLSPIADQLQGYNACYFCAGVSSVGMKEDAYRKVTYDLTLGAAQTLVKQNPDMTFIYVSGASTDSTEKGSVMWARVKGKTENDLLKLGFRQAYMFRPGLMKATDAQKNMPKIYSYLIWMYPIIKGLFPGSACTLAEVARAMINVTLKGSDKKVLEVKDIVAMA